MYRDADFLRKHGVVDYRFENIFLRKKRNLEAKMIISIHFISLLVGVQREFTPPPTSRNVEERTTTPGGQLHQNGRTTPAKEPSKMDLGERKALWESLVCF